MSGEMGSSGNMESSSGEVSSSSIETSSSDQEIGESSSETDDSAYDFAYKNDASELPGNQSEANESTEDYQRTDKAVETQETGQVESNESDYSKEDPNDSAYDDAYKNSDDSTSTDIANETTIESQELPESAVKNLTESEKTKNNDETTTPNTEVIKASENGDTSVFCNSDEIDSKPEKEAFEPIDNQCFIQSEGDSSINTMSETENHFNVSDEMTFTTSDNEDAFQSLDETQNTISIKNEKQVGDEKYEINASNHVEAPLKTRPESNRSSQTEITRKIDGLNSTAQQEHILENGNKVFNAPEDTGQRLNFDQGYAVAGYEGTCGLCSCENIARLAGKDVTEADVIELATKEGLCESGSPNPGDNGGTHDYERQEILSKMGIDSVLSNNLNVESIAYEVESGKGVIASVNVEQFWDDFPYPGGHAVTVTSVERDQVGNVQAFYVCDSGSGENDYARRVDAQRFQQSLINNTSLNITRQPIR